MKTAKILSLSLLTMALSGCVIHVQAQRANVTLQEALSLNSKGLSTFDIEAGAGSLIIVGEDNINSIEVDADIRTTEDKNYTLYLEKQGNTAKLVAKHNSSSGYWNGSSPEINLTIKMPKNLMLDIDDGSGDIEVANINSDVRLDDGSGSVDLQKIVGNVNVEDGSGSINFEDIKGNLVLDDGSGGAYINNVTGNVNVDDGSGELTIENVGGKVTIDDGSGGIKVSKAGSLKIIDSGSGSLSIAEVKGEVDIDS